MQIVCLGRSFINQELTRGWGWAANCLWPLLPVSPTPNHPSPQTWLRMRLVGQPPMSPSPSWPNWGRQAEPTHAWIPVLGLYIKLSLSLLEQEMLMVALNKRSYSVWKNRMAKNHGDLWEKGITSADSQEGNWEFSPTASSNLIPPAAPWSGSAL